MTLPEHRPTRRDGLERVPAWLLVVAAVVSVQIGSAVASTVVRSAGAGWAAVLRLAFASLILLVAIRPRFGGRSRRDWLVVIAFGCSLGWMNLSFYASIATLPIGVAVTVEFVGPLTLAAFLSKRGRDAIAILAAAAGVLLTSQALTTPLTHLDLKGLGLALLAGSLWAAYVTLSQATGQRFNRLDGLAIAMIVGLAAALPFAVVTPLHLTSDLVLRGLGLALLGSVLPYSLELLALRRLSPVVFGILLSLEPAVAALAGWIMLGQLLSIGQILGMALVVGASAIVLGGSESGGEVTAEPEA